MLNSFYKNKRVLVTGHTGFKGSWLSFWLNQMGATVIGYSLLPPTDLNHFDLLKLNITSIIGDIRDKKKLDVVIDEYKPEIVFHLAAQPIVRLSYLEPINTFETNVMGTINLFEACRNSNSVKSIVNITSDKCYDNKEWIWGYRENDAIGGYDPYSASKGMSELATASYRNSFFNNNEFGKTHNTLLASCRAGNVIGGGDWAIDRLIPDIMKATSQNKKVIIRNPDATRPWQHVLEPLKGYLIVAKNLFEGKTEYAEAWNFGPNDSSTISVLEIVKIMQKIWPKIDYEIQRDAKPLHEANLLKLDCSKAYSKLKWNSVWGGEETLQKTVEWYKVFYEEKRILTENQLKEYVAL